MKKKVPRKKFVNKKAFLLAHQHNKKRTTDHVLRERKSFFWAQKSPFLFFSFHIVYGFCCFTSFFFSEQFTASLSRSPTSLHNFIIAISKNFQQIFQNFMLVPWLSCVTSCLPCFYSPCGCVYDKLSRQNGAGTFNWVKTEFNYWKTKQHGWLTTPK